MKSRCWEAWSESRTAAQWLAGVCLQRHDLIRQPCNQERIRGNLNPAVGAHHLQPEESGAPSLKHWPNCWTGQCFSSVFCWKHMMNFHQLTKLILTSTAFLVKYTLWQRCSSEQQLNRHTCNFYSIANWLFLAMTADNNNDISIWNPVHKRIICAVVGN